jgi:hypothetical protein
MTGTELSLEIFELHPVEITAAQAATPRIVVDQCLRLIIHILPPKSDAISIVAETSGHRDSGPME